jgi:hypothetical protein
MPRNWTKTLAPEKLLKASLLEESGMMLPCAYSAEEGSERAKRASPKTHSAFHEERYRSKSAAEMFASLRATFHHLNLNAACPEKTSSKASGAFSRKS